MQSNAMIISSNVNGIRLAWDKQDFPFLADRQKATLSVLFFDEKFCQLLLVAGSIQAEPGAASTIVKVGNVDAEERERLQLVRSHVSLQRSMLIDDYTPIYFSPVNTSRIVPAAELTGDDLEKISRTLGNSLHEAWLVSCDRFDARLQGRNRPNLKRSGQTIEAIPILPENEDDDFKSQMAPGVKARVGASLSVFDAVRDREEVSDAIRLLNRAKEQLGEAFTLTLDESGRLNGSLQIAL